MNWRRLERRWNSLERSLIGGCAALALVLEALAMSTRYLAPQWSLDWIEEAVIYLIVWGTWLAGSQLVGQGQHIHADLLLRCMPPPWLRAAQLAGAVLGLGFCLALSVGAWQVVHFAILSGERSEDSLALPLAWYYCSMALGAALMSGKYALVAVRLWRRD